jgi:hypothetical protein
MKIENKTWNCSKKGGRGQEGEQLRGKLN